MWDLSVTQLGEKLCESFPPSSAAAITTPSPPLPLSSRDGLLTSIRRFSQHWAGPGKRTNDVIPSEMTLKCQSAAADIIHLAHIFLQHLFVFRCSSSRSWSSPPSSVPPGSAEVRCQTTEDRLQSDCVFPCSYECLAQEDCVLNMICVSRCISPSCFKASSDDNLSCLQTQVCCLYISPKSF